MTSIFFVAGYLTYYDSNFYIKLRSHKRRLVSSIVTKLILLGVLFCLQAAVWTVNQGSEMYVNLILFVVAYPLVDESNSLADYLWHWALMSVFWVINHPFQPQLFVLVALILLLFCIVVRHHQHAFHYQAVANLCLFVALGLICWQTRIGLATSAAWGYSLIFAAMSGYAYTYVRRVHMRALERAKLSESVMSDPLTHAYSRTRLREQGRADFARCQNEQLPLAVAVLDIDYFKSINDEFGHAAGDEVLRAVVALLQQRLAKAPGKPALYRTGGEELTILMPDCTLEQAVAIVRDCWTAVRTVPIAYADDHLHCSVSIGVAVLEQRDTALADVLKRADDSLYLSKQNGRDRITVDGQADLLNNSHSTMLNYTYYTQPVMRIADSTVASSELRLAVYADGHWGEASDYSVTLATMMTLIEKIDAQLETPSLAMNFEVAELLDSRIRSALIAYMRTHQGACGLQIELKTMPDPAGFARVAPAYQAAGIHFVIDDCATAAKLTDFAPVLRYFDVVKVPLIAKPTPQQLAALHANLAFWHKLCVQHRLALVLVGIETDAGLRLCDRYQAAYGQGNYFSRPVLPRIM